MTKRQAIREAILGFIAAMLIIFVSVILGGITLI